MTTQDMIKALQNRFDSGALGQAVWLETSRTTNIEDCTVQELETLYNRFFPKKNYALQVYEMELDNELKRLRSIILSDATKIGIYTVGDWTRFNQFMKAKSVLKKDLKDYKLEEFPSLIKQFKSIRYHISQQAMKPGTKAWYQYLGLVAPSLN
jgi:hypothetical protein